jgi:multidrug resistance efflux pump
VSPLFAGKVVKVHCKPGDSVVAGQILAELDSSLLRQEAAVLQARVDLASSQLKLSQAGFRSEEVLEAQAGVDRALARLKRAEADAAREQQLFDAGVSPRATFDAAQAELGQAQAELATAKAQLALKQNGARREEIGVSESSLSVARAELTRVQQQIGQCRIKAPSAGVVYEIEVPEGGWVDPAGNSESSGEILRLFDPQALQAYADVNQRDSARVHVGQPVELTSDAYPSEPVPGVVERIMPQANLQRNTVRVIVAIPAVPGYLKPEMNLKVTFLDETDQSAGTAATDKAAPPEAEPTEASR